MKLIDTSSWIEALRPKGRAEIKERVHALLNDGRACWCDAVRIELWNSRTSEQESKLLRAFDEDLPNLPIDEKVWTGAIRLAQVARSEGITVPAMDLLIFECARQNEVSIESADQHFRALFDLKLK